MVMGVGTGLYSAVSAFRTGEEIHVADLVGNMLFAAALPWLFVMLKGIGVAPVINVLFGKAALLTSTYILADTGLAYLDMQNNLIDRTSPLGSLLGLGLYPGRQLLSIFAPDAIGAILYQERTTLNNWLDDTFGGFGGFFSLAFGFAEAFIGIVTLTLPLRVFARPDITIKGIINLVTQGINGEGNLLAGGARAVEIGYLIGYLLGGWVGLRGAGQFVSSIAVNVEKSIRGLVGAFGLQGAGRLGKIGNFIAVNSGRLVGFIGGTLEQAPNYIIGTLL